MCLGKPGTLDGNAEGGSGVFETLVFELKDVEVEFVSKVRTDPMPLHSILANEFGNLRVARPKNGNVR